MYELPSRNLYHIKAKVCHFVLADETHTTPAIRANAPSRTMKTATIRINLWANSYSRASLLSSSSASYLPIHVSRKDPPIPKTPLHAIALSPALQVPGAVPTRPITLKACKRMHPQKMMKKDHGRSLQEATKRCMQMRSRTHESLVSTKLQRKTRRTYGGTQSDLHQAALA